MVYLIDPGDVFKNPACTSYCKGVAFPLYGIPCQLYCRTLI